MRVFLIVCLLASALMMGGCASSSTTEVASSTQFQSAEDVFIASEQAPADERERACMFKAAQTLNELSYYGFIGGLTTENPLSLEDNIDPSIPSAVEEMASTLIVGDEEQQEAYLEAHAALFGTVEEITFSVDPDTHLVMISAVLAEIDPIKARDLGNAYARLFDYYANRYLEITELNKDDPAAYYLELENSEVSFTEASEAIGAYEDGYIGSIYETYDFTSELDNPAKTLDVSGFKPAGPDGQLTWQ